MSRPTSATRTAVEAMLRKGAYTPKQLSEQTGSTIAHVRNAINSLRDCRSPLVANILREHRVLAEPSDPRPDPAMVVPLALATRSALEQVWR